LNAEITQIFNTGIGLKINKVEFFLSYEKFPVFKEASVADILNVESNLGHYYWPTLDVDLTLEMIKRPERTVSEIMDYSMTEL